MGTNYCKNITYDNSTLSRLDAHAGVYNASIINGSNVIMVSLIGGGTALIEDSTIHSNYFVNLRNDYGSTWNGDVIIRNSTLKTSSATPRVFIGTWYHHYFGYTCYLPNLIMDNVTVTSDYMIYLYTDFTGTSTIYENMPDDETKHQVSDVDISADKVMINGKLYDNVNKTELPRYIIIKNCDDLNYGYSPDYTLNEQLKEIHKNSNEE